MKIRRVITAANIDFVHPKNTVRKYSFIQSRTNIFHNANIIQFLVNSIIKSQLFSFCFHNCWSDSDKIPKAVEF